MLEVCRCLFQFFKLWLCLTSCGLCKQSLCCELLDLSAYCDRSLLIRNSTLDSLITQLQLMTNKLMERIRRIVRRIQMEKNPKGARSRKWMLNLVQCEAQTSKMYTRYENFMMFALQIVLFFFHILLSFDMENFFMRYLLNDGLNVS